MTSDEVLINLHLKFNVSLLPRAALICETILIIPVVQESEAFTTKSVYPVDHEWYEEQKEKILSDYASLNPAIRSSLTRARQDFPGVDEREYGSWEQWREDTQLQEETRFVAEKVAIMRDLEALKATVTQLLDANETCPEIERLPISVFDLNKADRDQKLKAAKDEREDVRMELEHLCASTDRVASWIKETFWDPQIVLGRSIFSFRGDLEVTNYPLVEGDPHFKDHLQWAQFARDSVRRIVDDTFQPWRNYTDEQLRAELSKPVRVHREDKKRRMDVFLEDEEREIDPEELAELRAMEGIIMIESCSVISIPGVYIFASFIAKNQYFNTIKR